MKPPRQITLEEIKRHFPNASRGTIAANVGRDSDVDPAGFRAAQREQPTRPLGESAQRKIARSRSGGARYRITFTIYTCHPLDWDNAAAAVKATQDAIVRAGWLPDDDWKTLEGMAGCIKVGTRAEQRTEIVLERII